VEAPNFDPLAKIDSSFDEALQKDISEGRLLDWLWQNDRNCMQFGLEARSPFLDVSLEPYLYTGYKNKFVRQFNKYELRSVFAQFDPLPTQWRVQKQGFRWSPKKFMISNAKRVMELCSQSNVLRELVPNLPELLDGARNNPKKVSSLAFERMLPIAAVEQQLGIL